MLTYRTKTTCEDAAWWTTALHLEPCGITCCRVFTFMFCHLAFWRFNPQWLISYSHSEHLGVGCFVQGLLNTLPIPGTELLSHSCLIKVELLHLQKITAVTNDREARLIKPLDDELIVHVKPLQKLILQSLSEAKKNMSPWREQCSSCNHGNTITETGEGTVWMLLPYEFVLTVSGRKIPLNQLNEQNDWGKFILRASLEEFPAAWVNLQYRMCRDKEDNVSVCSSSLNPLLFSSSRKSHKGSLTQI